MEEPKPEPIYVVVAELLSYRPNWEDPALNETARRFWKCANELSTCLRESQDQLQTNDSQIVSELKTLKMSWEVVRTNEVPLQVTELTALHQNLEKLVNQMGVHQREVQQKLSKLLGEMQRIIVGPNYFIAQQQETAKALEQIRKLHESELQLLQSNRPLSQAANQKAGQLAAQFVLQREISQRLKEEISRLRDIKVAQQGSQAKMDRQLRDLELQKNHMNRTLTWQGLHSLDHVRANNQAIDASSGHAAANSAQDLRSATTLIRGVPANTTSSRESSSDHSLGFKGLLLGSKTSSKTFRTASFNHITEGLNHAQDQIVNMTKATHEASNQSKQTNNELIRQSTDAVVKLQQANASSFVESAQVIESTHNRRDDQLHEDASKTTEVIRNLNGQRQEARQSAAELQVALGYLQPLAKEETQQIEAEKIELKQQRENLRQVYAQTQAQIQTQLTKIGYGQGQAMVKAATDVSSILSLLFLLVEHLPRDLAERREGFKSFVYQHRQQIDYIRTQICSLPAMITETNQRRRLTPARQIHQQSSAVARVSPQEQHQAILESVNLLWEEAVSCGLLKTTTVVKSIRL